MKVKPIRFAASVLAGLLAVSLTACGADDSDTGDSGSGTPAGADAAVRATLPADFVKGGTFKVALFENAPPDAYHEGDQIVGWQADMAREVGKVFGVKTEIVPSANFDSLIPGLQAKRFDASFSSFYITPERLKVADFATVGSVGTGFGTAAGSGLSIDETTDLCGTSAATLAGSTFINQLKTISGQCQAAEAKPIQVQTYPNNSDGVLAVGTGRAQVFVTSSNELAALITQSNGKVRAGRLIYEKQQLAEAFVKGSPLAPAAVAALNVLIKNGTYAKILDKYGVSTAAIEASQLNPTS